MQPVFDVSQTVELTGREAAAHRMAAAVRGGVDGKAPITDSAFEVAA